MKTKAIVYTLKRANANYGVMGKYLVIDSRNGKPVINAVYNFYNTARKMASLFNAGKLSACDILNVTIE